MRLVHISDLHCSKTVSAKYLRNCIERINELNADIVVMTGDYVTCDIYGKYRKKIVELVGKIESKLGVFACLGNHDYGIDRWNSRQTDNSVYKMTDVLRKGGVTVLRNQSNVVELDGGRIWLVGLGDLWADDFQPEKAFAGVAKDGTVIALTHNPAAVKHLKTFNFDAAMCGHTHGIKFQLSPSFRWPVLNRHDYHSGLYHLGNRKLYVNRGLGRLGKALFNKRPEITLFKLR
jgi:predicted MPP superfamily phosphohydrolase